MPNVSKPQKDGNNELVNSYPAKENFQINICL